MTCAPKVSAPRSFPEPLREQLVNALAAALVAELERCLGQEQQYGEPVEEGGA